MWVLGSLAGERRYVQVELNSTCPHNDHSKLVLPISRPLNPLVKTDVLPKTYVLFIVLTVFLGPRPGALPLGEHINV